MNHSRFIGAFVVTAALSLAASPAAATDTPPEYVTVAWVVDNPADIWEVPQRTDISQTITGPSVDFAGVQALVGCGKFYQLDGYIDSDITDALLAGGILYGPSNPVEDLAHGAPGTEATNGTPWMYFTAPDCSETVCTDSFTHKTTTFNYVWDGVASVRNGVTSISTTLSEADAIAAGCYVPPIVDPLPPVIPDPPVVELAHAGPATLWLVWPAGLLLLLGGLSFVHVAKMRQVR